MLMAQKACTKCGIVKPYSQFSKLRKAKDGHQWHCKECNNKDNYRFRHELRPDYMQEWFDNHRAHWNEYSNDYQGSNNINKIYSITNPKGEVYIGFSRRKRIYFRWKEHKKFFKQGKNNIPLLYESFRKHGVENHTFEVIKEFKGSRREGKEFESGLIEQYQKQNKSLNLNK